MSQLIYVGVGSKFQHKREGFKDQGELSGRCRSCRARTPCLDWQLDSCMSQYTITDYLDDRNNNTPGVWLDKCSDRIYTYEGVLRYKCYCSQTSPEYARLHPSQCWYSAGFFSVVGSGYCSILVYCAHAESLPYFHYDKQSFIVGKKWDPGILDPSRFSGQIRKVEARLGKLAKIRKVETD